jgi:hypothetical protein
MSDNRVMAISMDVSLGRFHPVVVPSSFTDRTAKSGAHTVPSSLLTRVFGPSNTHNLMEQTLSEHMLCALPFYSNSKYLPINGCAIPRHEWLEGTHTTKLWGRIDSAIAQQTISCIMGLACGVGRVDYLPGGSEWESMVVFRQ